MQYLKYGDKGAQFLSLLEDNFNVALICTHKSENSCLTITHLRECWIVRFEKLQKCYGVSGAVR